MRVIAVTGASAGVGRAVVHRFALNGARLGLIARGQERLEAAAAEVERLGGEALVLPLDVADYDAVEAAAAQIEERFGPLDVWVNNAMATVFAPVSRITPDEFRRATEVTYLGYVWGTLAALRRMLPRDRGTIVQVGSALTYRSIPLQAPYCAAKHAVHGFTPVAADGAAPRGIERPRERGAAARPQHPAVRVGEGEAAAASAARAADLPARGRGEGDRACRQARAAGDPRRLADGEGRLRRADRAGPARPLPGADGLRLAADR